jgi:hypothetical protein
MRTASSYHQSGHGQETYAQHLQGMGRQSHNIHYSGQAFQLLSGQTQSGKRMKLHFIGKLEDFVSVRQCEFGLNSFVTHISSILLSTSSFLNAYGDIMCMTYPNTPCMYIHRSMIGSGCSTP